LVFPRESLKTPWGIIFVVQKEFRTLLREPLAFLEENLKPSQGIFGLLGKGKFKASLGNFWLSLGRVDNLPWGTLGSPRREFRASSLRKFWRFLGRTQRFP